MLKMTGSWIAMPRNRAAHTSSQYLTNRCHSHQPGQIIITIIITTMIVMMLSSCFKHCESSPGSSGECRLERQVAANIHTKTTDLGCESSIILVPSTSTIAIFYYSARKLILMLQRHTERHTDIHTDTRTHRDTDRKTDTPTASTRPADDTTTSI